MIFIISYYAGRVSDRSLQRFRAVAKPAACEGEGASRCGEREPITRADLFLTSRAHTTFFQRTAQPLS